MKDKNFRKFTTSSGKEVLGGKNAEQNEELLKSNVDNEDIVMHTASPGSPFCVIKGKANKKDMGEAAVFCARYSQEWKKSKKKHDIIVHMFKGKDIFKEKGMKTGTFGVKKAKIIKVKKEDIEKL